MVAEVGEEDFHSSPGDYLISFGMDGKECDGAESFQLTSGVELLQFFEWVFGELGCAAWHASVLRVVQTFEPSGCGFDGSAEKSVRIAEAAECDHAAGGHAADTNPR